MPCQSAKRSLVYFKSAFPSRRATVETLALTLLYLSVNCRIRACQPFYISSSHGELNWICIVHAPHPAQPRYRLMLRRCLASPTPRFGMVMPRQNANTTDSNDYGTMLEIRSVQMLSDGRSMVETYGTFRFRILERGSLDGYSVARIERQVCLYLCPNLLMVMQD